MYGLKLYTTEIIMDCYRLLSTKVESCALRVCTVPNISYVTLCRVTELVKLKCVLQQNVVGIGANVCMRSPIDKQLLYFENMHNFLVCHVTLI